MPELTIDQAFQIALDHHQRGRLQEAETLYRKIIAYDPNHANSIHLLGVIALQAGKPQSAVELIQRAIGLRPNIAIYHNNLGQALERIERHEDAAKAYRIAIQLDPRYAEPHNNLGNILEREHKLPEAIASYERATALNLRYAEPYTNLGNIYKDQGDLDRAIACYRKAVELRPDLSLLHSNLLLALHYHPGFSSAALAEEHRLWRRRHADPLATNIKPHLNSRDPDRRLRIGYVSPDFREHPVARFMLPLLSHHDRRQFEIFAYADISTPDETTSRIRSHIDVWRDTTRLNDARVADLVYADQIDILIDLAAHTSHSRVLAFARKPAPIQVTYLAYCSTTGLDTIDYRLSDPYLDPQESDPANYSEQTIRLPQTYWCYSAPPAAPEVNRLPAGESNPITFGCLNNFCKVTDATLDTWGNLLQAVPNSHLLLYARAGSHRQRVIDHLADYNVDGSRITFVAKQSLQDYFATYHRIDIGLDPFPFTGGTTTCDALWMGVPVVTLSGMTAVSRGGNSLLSNIGLPELIAYTTEDYTKIALQLAENRARLQELRATLRGRLQSSPVMDAPVFARNIEAAYREMWMRWCRNT